MEKKDLKQELELLRQELGTPAFDEHLDRMENVYTSDEDKKLISEYVTLMMGDIDTELKEVNKEIETIRTVKSISNMISFKYIAETYFNKSKAWFSQRLNGNTVHGKVQDISKKIGSLSI